MTAGGEAAGRAGGNYWSTRPQMPIPLIVSAGAPEQKEFTFFELSRAGVIIWRMDG
jgi:hypothetical protein